MEVFKLGKRKYSHDLTGKGAELYGGRWNLVGIPCIYTSGTRSLSFLEYTANVQLDNIPRALTYTIYEIPDSEIVDCPISTCPGNWADRPPSLLTQQFGTDLLNNDPPPLILRVPSVIISQEFNYIINPKSDKFNLIKILNIEDHVYDIRIKM